MNNLFAIWTPGPIELIIMMFAVIVLFVGLILIRWLFRINERTRLLSQIRDELKKLNINSQE